MVFVPRPKKARRRKVLPRKVKIGTSYEKMCPEVDSDKDELFVSKDEVQKEQLRVREIAHRAKKKARDFWANFRARTLTRRQQTQAIRRAVMKGVLRRTRGGLTEDMMFINKGGRVCSKLCAEAINRNKKVRKRAIALKSAYLKLRGQGKIVGPVLIRGEDDEKEDQEELLFQEMQQQLNKLNKATPSIGR